MKKKRLMAPGPTPVPENVLLEMAKPIIHHRTPQFQAVLKRVNDKLKDAVKTTNPVLILASSGSGAMEASVVNFLSAGDKALIIKGGKFGERFAEICSVYGVQTIDYDVKWGETADPDVIAEMLKENPDVKAVYSTLCETSTGVVNDIKAIGNVVSSKNAILVVDAISGLFADEFEPDNWGVDIVIAGSQKGFMLPPGLAFLSVSKKAQEFAGKSNLPKYYFDVKTALISHANDSTPWTPPISLILGLETVLDMLLEEGIDNVVKRHARLANVTREAIKTIGLEVFASVPSNAVTSVTVPEGIDGGLITKMMRDEQMITIAGGQSSLKGKIFRIGHLGYMDDFDIISVIAALEIVLFELGYNVEMGKGVAKAQELLKSDKWQETSDTFCKT